MTNAKTFDPYFNKPGDEYEVKNVSPYIPGHPNFGYTATLVRKQRKIGRNEPCPCGSGKKFKACCIAREADGYGEREPTA